MKGVIDGVAVRSVAAALPAHVLEMAALAESFGEAEVRRIMRSTGITRVHVAPPGVCASDLCEAAARALLEPEVADRVGAVVFVSQTPDHPLPPTSALLQHRLGLPTATAAFDLNFGCSGFVQGLLQAALLIHAGACDAVLVCAGDVTTRIVNPRDRALRMLFGDAGSAAIVERGKGSLAFATATDGSGKDVLTVPAGGAREPRSEQTAVAVEDEHGNYRSREDLFMDGMEVMNYSLRDVPSTIETVLAARGWSPDEVGFFGLHQANVFLLDYLRKKMRLAAEAVPVAVAETGNTGPASIPLMLSLCHRRLAEEGRLEKAVLCGYGVGFSVAACTCDLSATRFVGPLHIEHG